MKNCLKKCFPHKKQLQKNELELQIYMEFVSFRTKFSFFFVLAGNTINGVLVAYDFISISNYLLVGLAVGFIILVNCLFVILLRKPKVLSVFVFFLLIINAVIRISLSIFEIDVKENCDPYHFMFHLMVSLLTAKTVPSYFIQACLFFTELGQALFYVLFLPEIINDSYFIYIYMVTLAFFSINTIIVDKKLWKCFSDSWKANNQVESLKKFLDENLLSSIGIFSLPEINDDSGQEQKLGVEFINSISRRLGMQLIFGEEEVSTIGRGLSRKSFEDQGGSISMEETLNCFVRIDSNRPLYSEIQEYAREEAQRAAGRDRAIEIIEEKKEPLSFICELNKEKRRQISKANEEISLESIDKTKKTKKSFYKAVLSPIKFNKKDGVILQLEDITAMKSLEKEKKVSRVREKTIQYI